jgi:hypothetical protein
VQPFPSGGRKWSVSPRGGAEPRWRDDGRELYYLARDHSLMAVSIEPVDQKALEISVPQKLFVTESGCQDPAASPTYVVASHGQRFLSIAADHAGGQPLTAVVNWRSLLGSVPSVAGDRRRPDPTSVSALLSPRWY